MTGPEHYQEAERLLARHTDAMQELDSKLRSLTSPDLLVALQAAGVLVTTAQAHAALALVAATALKGVGDPDKWLDVAG